MKLFAVLAALIAAASADIVRDGFGWYVPLLDGFIEIRHRGEFQTTCGGPDKIDFNPINYYLYTNADPLDGKKLNISLTSLKSSPYKKDTPTFFVIHGWRGSYDDHSIYKIIKAWLGRGDYNVIAVDWVRGRYSGYCEAFMAVRRVGISLIDMVELLTDNELITASQVHLIGFDLGAHIAGVAGKLFRNGKIKSITGLDPALPGFVRKWTDSRLYGTDAEYVETIVTSAGIYGTLEPIGKAAFYVDGGEHQKGCIGDIFGICAHKRALTYYAEAVQHNNFGTYKCPHYRTAVQKSCAPKFSDVRMGNTLENTKRAEGIYYVPINSKPPFGISPST